MLQTVRLPTHIDKAKRNKTGCQLLLNASIACIHESSSSLIEHMPHIAKRIWWTNTKCLWCDGGNVYFPSSLAWKTRKALWTQSTQRLLLIRCFHYVKKFLPCTHLHIREIGWHVFFGYFLTILHRFLKAQGCLLVTRGFSEICAPKKGLDFQSIKEIWNQSICLFFLNDRSSKTHILFHHIVVILRYHLMACRKSIEPNHHILLLHGPCPVVSLRIQCMEYLDIECLASKGCKELIRSVLNQYVQPILSLHKNDLFRNAWSTCWQFNHTPLLEPTVMPSLSLSA